MNLDFLIKVIRYGGSSLLAVGADVGLMWLLFSLANVSYLMAAAVGFTVGGVVKYLVSKYMVYEDNREGNKTMSIILFISFAIGCLLLNQVIIYVGVEFLNAHLLIAKLFSAGIIFVLNFFLIGLFVFKDPLYKRSDAQ